MLFSEAIVLYTAHRTSAGFANSTNSNAYRNLTRILETIGDIPVETIAGEPLDRFFSIEMSRGLSPGTLNSVQYILASFSRWLKRRGYITELQDLIGDRRAFPDPPKQRNYVAASDFPRLLTVAEQGPTGQRDRALMAAALYLMVRASELTHIKVKDINLTHDEVEIFVKKTNERDTMPISLELHMELEEWLTYYRSVMGELDPEWVLFPRYRTVAYHQFEMDTTASIGRPQLVVARCLKGIGWKDDWIGVHVLRRSSARARFEENIDAGYDAAMREIQSWLHHKSIATTEHYLGMTHDRERRNDRTKGKLMYPSVSQVTGIKVIPLKGSGEAHG